MQETEVKTVATQQPTVNSTTEQKVEQVKANAKATMQAKPDRTFTRDEVTRILKARLDRYQNGLYGKYGVKNINELDALFEKTKGYDDLVTERDGLKSTNSELSEKVAFMENNIDPARYDDIKTYFKGKGQIFDSGVLAEMLKTHPEWLKQTPAVAKPQTTFKKIGSPQSTSPIETAEMKEKRIFGI